MADVPVLVGTTGDLRGEHIVVPEEGGLSVGRADDNDIVITSDGTSRYHARLLYDNGTLWLRDNGSRNGVFVNDVRVVGHKALKVGDVVSIVGNRFEVCWAEDAATAAPPADRDLAPIPEPVSTTDDGDDETSEVARPETKRRWFWPFS